MKKALLGLAVCALVVVATANAARDPRLETLALKPADVTLARAAAVRLSDLSPGWKPAPLPPGGEQAPDCPDYRPDFSKFTITGQATSQFSAQSGAASITSRTEVYATKEQARGDFTVSTLPPVARCLGIMFQRETAKAANGLTVKVLSAQRVAAPRLGDRSAAYRIVTELGQDGSPTTLKAYVDIAIVQRGRSVGGIFFTGVLQPVPDRQRVVARMTARLR